MLQVQNLTKRYGDKTAVNDMSFIVPDGKVTGFLGPNGAGKIDHDAHAGRTP